MCVCGIPPHGLHSPSCACYLHVCVCGVVAFISLLFVVQSTADDAIASGPATGECATLWFPMKQRSLATPTAIDLLFHVQSLTPPPPCL